jgi:hypothetical protein
MGVCLFMYFWGGFFGDDFSTTWQQKKENLIKLRIPQPFHTFIPKAHKNYLSKNNI